MIWVDIIAVIVLFLSFVGGLKEGAIKNSFSLIALLIAIPVTGVSYHLVASILSFLPGKNWENFMGFFITMGLIILTLYFAFLIPRRLIQKIWKKGVFVRLIGSALNILNAAIGIVVFILLVEAYPIFGWLERVVLGSGVLNWLVVNLNFISAMLPFT